MGTITSGSYAVSRSGVRLMAGKVCRLRSALLMQVAVSFSFNFRCRRGPLSVRAATDIGRKFTKLS